MRKLAKLVVLAVLMALPLTSSDAAAAESLKKVRSDFVCMVNDRYMGAEQIPVTVGGKTYYGCCAMCKAKLEKNAAVRQAVDPVSRKTVDKARAVIGAKSDKTVYYFENEKNMKAFR